MDGNSQKGLARGAPGPDRARSVVALVLADGQELADHVANDLTDIAIACPASAEQARAALQSVEARVVLVAVGLAECIGVPALIDLRRHFPGADWVFAWRAPHQPSAELIVNCRARGSVDWSLGPLVVRRAIDAVLAGELWFSRTTLPVLWDALLSALAVARHGAAGHETQATVDGGALGSQASREALTQRELEALALMRQGLTNRQIGTRMGISASTVKKHLAHAFSKVGLHSRRQALTPD